MKILCVDPSVRCSGYAVLQLKNINEACLLHGGTIPIKRNVHFGEAFFTIYNKLNAVRLEHPVSALVTESAFLKTNKNSYDKLCMLAGVLELFAVKYNIEHKNFNPIYIRKIVCGNHRCNKQTVRDVLIDMEIINEDDYLNKVGEPQYDVTDAIAVGLTYFDYIGAKILC